MGDLTMKWLLIWKSEFLNSIHTLASKNLKDFWHVSINCIHIFNRLELKGNPASDEVEELFAKILPVDSSVKANRHSKGRQKLQNYMNLCCVQFHYFFSIRKCGSTSCTIIMETVFQQLHPFLTPWKHLLVPILLARRERGQVMSLRLLLLEGTSGHLIANQLKLFLVQ